MGAGRKLLGLVMAMAAGPVVVTACVPGVGSIDGNVSYETEAGPLGASGITVSLSPADLTPGRPPFRLTTTDDVGNYRYEDLEAGCYLIAFEEPPGFSAPDAFITDQPNTRQFCLDQDEVAAGPNLTLVADERMASLGGQVTSQSTGGTENLVLVEVFTADADGNRDRFVGDTITGFDGRFSFAVIADCFRLTFIAPDGRTFPSGSPDGKFFETVACVDTGEQELNIDAVLN